MALKAAGRRGLVRRHTCKLRPLMSIRPNDQTTGYIAAYLLCVCVCVSVCLFLCLCLCLLDNCRAERNEAK